MPKTTRLTQEISRIQKTIKSLQGKGYKFNEIAMPKTLKEARKITKETLKTQAVKPELMSHGRIVHKKPKPTSRKIKKLVDDEEIKSKRKKIEEERQKRNKPKADKTTSNKKGKRGADKQKRKTRSDKGVKRGSRNKEEYPTKESVILDNLIMLIDRLDNADITWGVGKRGQIRRRTPDEIMLSETARTSLLGLLNQQIREVGETQLAQRLEQQANWGELTALVDKMLHGYSDEIRPSFMQMVSYIKGTMLSMDETKEWSEVDNSMDWDYGEE